MQLRQGLYCSERQDIYPINLDFQDEETDTILLTIVNNAQED